MTGFATAVAEHLIVILLPVEAPATTVGFAAAAAAAVVVAVAAVEAFKNSSGYGKPKSRLVALHRKVSSSVSRDLDVPPATNGCEAISRISEINRPVRPGSLRTGTDGLPPSVLGPNGDGAFFLNVDGDGWQRWPGTVKSASPAVIHPPRPTSGG
ncbi:hypothetical protein BDD12DRAFT_896993 [Trichophaea hybrida]|nr:hypothetical protein BDD12DRAFT_896993 [Trichophaea hybrida]